MYKLFGIWFLLIFYHHIIHTVKINKGSFIKNRVGKPWRESSHMPSQRSQIGKRLLYVPYKEEERISPCNRPANGKLPHLANEWPSPPWTLWNSSSQLPPFLHKSKPSLLFSWLAFGSPCFACPEVQFSAIPKLILLANSWLSLSFLKVNNLEF